MWVFERLSEHRYKNLALPILHFELQYWHVWAVRWKGTKKCDGHAFSYDQALLLMRRDIFFAVSLRVWPSNSSSSNCSFPLFFVSFLTLLQLKRYIDIPVYSPFYAATEGTCSFMCCGWCELWDHYQFLSNQSVYRHKDFWVSMSNQMDQPICYFLQLLSWSSFPFNTVVTTCCSVLSTGSWSLIVHFCWAWVCLRRKTDIHWSYLLVVWSRNVR